MKLSAVTDLTHLPLFSVPFCLLGYQQMVFFPYIKTALMFIWLNLRCCHNCESCFCCELTLHKQKEATFGLRYYKKYLLFVKFNGLIFPISLFKLTYNISDKVKNKNYLLSLRCPQQCNHNSLMCNQ